MKTVARAYDARAGDGAGGIGKRGGRAGAFLLGGEVVMEEGVAGGDSLAAGEADTRDASAAGRRRAAPKERRVIVGVVHFRAFPPGDPAIATVAVEEVVPG